VEEKLLEKVVERVVEKLKSDRHETFEQSPKTMGLSNDQLLEKFTAELIKHRSPCHDLSKDDIHALKSMIKSKLRLAKTKGALKITVAGLIIREIWLFLKENVHWGP
jgi:hypothetical protein